VSCSTGLPLEGKAPRPGPRGANCARGATDYVRAYPQLIAFYVDAPYTALGTGSFERSDTLSALPHFFRGRHPPCRLTAFATEGQVLREKVAEGIACYGLEMGRRYHVRLEGMQKFFP